MQGQVVYVLNPFLSFIVYFQPAKAHNMLAMMLDLCYKGVRLVIWYVSKERVLHIASEYDRQVLLPFLVHAHHFLNPNDVGVGTHNCFASQSIKSTSLYDIMETNKEMASLIVKKQLNHFQVKKNDRRKVHVSIGMVDSVGNIISLCWVCSLTIIRDCWFSD